MSNFYVNYRSKIKSGDLLTWSTENPVTWLDWALFIVQFVTRSSFDHNGIAWVVGDRVLVVEAVYPKVRITELSQKGNFYHLSIPLDWNESFNTFLLSKVGMKYSFLNIFKKWLGIGEVNPYEQFCSQLAADFYTSIGFIQRDEIGYTPKSVMDGLMAKTGNGLIKVLTK